MRWPSGPSTTKASTAPLRIASIVSSASSSRRRSCAFSACKCASVDTRSAAAFLVGVMTVSRWAPGPIVASVASRLRMQVQTQEHPFLVGQVADQSAQRQRQLLDERGHGNNLLVLRQCRLLVYVDHLELVTPLQVFLTDGLDAGKRLGGA